MRRRKGTSLPELSMVILVITILSSTLVSVYDDAMNGARYARADGEIATLGAAVARYRYDMNEYPSSIDLLATQSPIDGKTWITPQMLPANDPWGNRCGINGAAGSGAYCYAYTVSGFAIWTMGANKANNSGGGAGSLPAAFSTDDKGVFGK